MALSGTITGTTANKYITAKIVWSATQSITDNTSTVTAKLYYIKSSSSTSATQGTWSGSITIGGNKKDFSGVKLNLPANGSSVLAATYTETITHNADGTKSITISASGAMSGTSLSSTTCSGTAALDTIPRKANITAAPNFNDEGNPTITYSNSAGNVVTSLQACIASNDGVNVYVPYRDISKTGTSYTFNLTAAERTALRQAFTTSNSGTVKFYVKTVLAGTTYYSNVSKTFTIINGNPTLNPTVEDVNSATLALTGDKNKLVKYYSNARVTTGAAAVKNASLASQKATLGAAEITAASGTFNNVESGNFVFSATDSRGNTATKNVNKTLINYVRLTCNLTANAPTTSGDMSFTINGNYFNGSFGAVNNSLTVQYRYKTNSGSYGAWTAATATKSGNTYKANVNITGLNYLNSYTVQARAIDAIVTGGIESKAKTVKTTPIFDWGENDFNFNVPVTVQGYNLLGLAKAISHTYPLKTTATPSTNYSEMTTTDAVLMGNNLRCYFAATRSAATGAGNVANEIIGSITIKHGGKIKACYSNTFGNGATGGLASFTILNAQIDDTTLTFDISLAATGTAGTQFAAYFILPVALNLDAY